MHAVIIKNKTKDVLPIEFHRNFKILYKSSILFLEMNFLYHSTTIVLHFSVFIIGHNCKRIND